MKKKTILIVDDDRLVLTGMRRDLESEGYEVLTAESGEAAVKLCRANPPDLVLLDIRMPGIAGMEVARWLRAETSVAFLFLSAYHDRDLVKEAAAHGALGYLVKPVDIPQVVAVLESALARAEEIRELRRREATLSEGLTGNRAVSAAVGIIMERYRLTQRAAFETLRARARAERRKIGEVAADQIRAAEVLNGQHPA